MTDEIIEHPFESELMLYHKEKDNVHVLNPTARAIYTLCKEGKGHDEIEKFLRERFRIDPQLDIRQDVENCMAELERMGLIK